MTAVVEERRTRAAPMQGHAATTSAAATARYPRSHLLAIASAVTVAVALLLAVALATLASAHVATTAISAAAAADRAMASALLEDLGTHATREPQSSGAEARLRRILEDAVGTSGLVGIALLGPDGRTWERAGGERGVDVGEAAAGRDASATLVDGSEGPLLVEVFPVELDGRETATLVVLRDGAPAVTAAAAAQRDIALAAGVGTSVAIVAVLLLFRRAQRRIDEQTRELIEAERRDPLTGQLTYGAALVELGIALEADLRPVAVALVDIDNFRQLNGTHGVTLGDAILRKVASRLGAGSVPGMRIGRSGPDEFIVIGPATDAATLSTMIEDANRDLLGTGIDTDGGDALPITTSAGIAVAPLHGRNVTELVSAAALTLGESKSGGGNTVLVSRLSYADLVAEHRATFSILDGLLNAIDSRDRYTRRHSEDVARYALFLARELGLDAGFCAALHHAAILHDVGKIAVPDDILRKPAALTPAETDIMRQHPVLGGTLVRDLSAAELVVDGVRHHHEWWDGTGYPDGLEGDAVPLIARIVAVADAYSAMTTARPYRRALRSATALERLARAAGTQLDPRLVDVFVIAMESATTPPLPSDARAPKVWLVEDSAA